MLYDYYFVFLPHSNSIWYCFLADNLFFLLHFLVIVRQKEDNASYVLHFFSIFVCMDVCGVLKNVLYVCVAFLYLLRIHGGVGWLVNEHWPLTAVNRRWLMPTEESVSFCFSILVLYLFMIFITILYAKKKNIYIFLFVLRMFVIGWFHLYIFFSFFLYMLINII